jgi:hypothetical protein
LENKGRFAKLKVSSLGCQRKDLPEREKSAFGMLIKTAFPQKTDMDFFGRKMQNRQPPILLNWRI